ncbi:hypothetical protein jhhlp_002267 [Lomentospora prolificans]|uniref:superoxide dismutase n=1 Tax=Lomentospora prolificans TaxID=41688 RepID=A0A2N3NDJ0_9PEZI|nr:hypothetical protein jhhlp_002267 [Lomentospora prolificans]
MRYQSLVALALAAATANAQDAPETGELGDATVVKDNPEGLVYKAEFPEQPFSPISIEGNVKGSLIAKSVEDGIEFRVKFENLPAEGGPFGYHLHVDPVPEDGNCTKTLAHLDPFIRGEATPCNPDAPATCQVGDLSGKHGAADSGTTFEDTYVDPYVTLKDGLGSFFGNRSVVLHFANKTRITCANFALVGGDGGEDEPDREGEDHDDTDEASTPSTGSNSTITPTHSAPAETNPSEGSAAVSSISLIAALAAAVFAL